MDKNNFENIKVADVQAYYENCGDGLLVHGTVSSVIEDILKEGLLVRDKDFPTVLSSNGGELKDGTPITRYTWYEPRAEGESVALVLQVPTEILNEIKSKGLPLSQKNIFDMICEDIELEVPDTQETRAAQINKQGIEQSGLKPLEGIMGPKFSSFGLKPGTKYKHVGIPPKYICAITSSNKAYYASQRVLEFINNLSNVRNKEENETLNVDLYSADELF